MFGRMETCSCTHAKSHSGVLREPYPASVWEAEWKKGEQKEC